LSIALKKQNTIVGTLLWNNHFYGICIAALSICSSLTLTDHLPSFWFLMIVYFATVAYYTNAYFNEAMNESNQDRAKWYQFHHAYLKKRQWLLAFILLTFIFFSVIKYPALLEVNLLTTFVLVISAIGSFLYNRTNFKKYGLAKSAVIAFVWTIMGGYLPLYFNSKMGYESSLTISLQFVYLIQMFLFIFLLAVIFDIKDMKIDQLNKIKTIPIQIGINHITQKLILPILTLYIFLDILQFRQSHLTPFVWIWYCMFYLVVYFASKRAIHEKSIVNSIFLIDSLMIVRALIGIFTWYWAHFS